MAHRHSKIVSLLQVCQGKVSDWFGNPLVNSNMVRRGKFVT